MTLNEYLKLAGVERPLAFGDFLNITLPKNSPPRDYQITDLNAALRNPWFALLHDPGLGKTIMSQAWTCYWVNEGYKVLVLTLGNLIGQYIDDFLETMPGIEKFISIDRYNQGPVKRKELEQKWDADGSWPQSLVMTYEGFSNLFKEKCPDGKPTWFYDRGYRVMVADEVHKRLTNIDTTLYRRVRAWRDNGSAVPLAPPHNETVFLPMTGTPIARTLTDSYGIIELTNPGKYVGYKHFEREHCQFKTVKLAEPIKTKGGKTIKQVKQLVGYRNHDKVNKLLFETGVRRVKDQVLDLKQPNIRRVKVVLSDEHYRLYAKLLKERYLELGDELILALNQQSLRQHALGLITCPERYVPEGEAVDYPDRIQEAVLDWLAEADLESQKVVLFMNRIASIEKYTKLLAAYNPALMYGDIANKERERLKILNDDSCRILIANPRSASAGLNLQRQSHNVLFVEPTGVYGDFKQGLERVFRSGQEHVVDVGIIQAMRTIAPKAIANMLDEHMDIEKAVVDKSRLLADLCIA